MDFDLVVFPVVMCILVKYTDDRWAFISRESLRGLEIMNGELDGIRCSRKLTASGKPSNSSSSYQCRITSERHPSLGVSRRYSSIRFFFIQVGAFEMLGSTLAGDPPVTFRAVPSFGGGSNLAFSCRCERAGATSTNPSRSSISSSTEVRRPGPDPLSVRSGASGTSPNCAAPGWCVLFDGGDASGAGDGLDTVCARDGVGVGDGLGVANARGSTEGFGAAEGRGAGGIISERAVISSSVTVEVGVVADLL